MDVNQTETLVETPKEFYLLLLFVYAIHLFQVCFMCLLLPSSGFVHHLPCVAWTCCCAASPRLATDLQWSESWICSVHQVSL